jgi:hypothetical protein
MLHASLAARHHSRQSAVVAARPTIFHVFAQGWQGKQGVICDDYHQFYFFVLCVVTAQRAQVLFCSCCIRHHQRDMEKSKVQYSLIQDSGAYRSTCGYCNSSDDAEVSSATHGKAAHGRCPLPHWFDFKWLLC